MQVQFAKLDDVKRLTDLVIIWTDEMNYDIDKEGLVEDVERAIKDGIAIYVMDNDKLVGIMTGFIIYHFWLKATVAHEHWFFVNPEYRKQGVGNLLLNCFEAWAKSKTCQSTIVTANAFGSVTPEIIANHLRKNGYGLHGFQMIKRVDGGDSNV